MPYTLEFGSYYFRSPGSSTIKHMSDEVAVAVTMSEQDGIYWLHKHGPPKDINEWWEKNRNERYEMFGEMAVVTVTPGISVDDLNQIIDTGGGYLGALGFNLRNLLEAQ